MAAKSCLLLLALAFSACGPSKKPGTSPTAGSAPLSLTLDIEPADAAVEVDGSSRGKASELKAIDLSPGTHQIVISKPGFEVWRGEVALETKPETIQVRLVPAK
jgi:hypothetical protein